MFPLRMASPDSFAVARSFLRDSGFSEEFLLSHFRLPALEPLLSPRGLMGDYFRGLYPGDGVALMLARLFIAGFPESRAAARDAMTSRVLDALLDLGLLVDAKDVPGSLRSPVLMYPAYGKFVCCDAGGRLDGTNNYGEADFVMSGTEDICRDFLEAFGKSPCETFLDMGSGSGLAALIGSDIARQVWAVDITERAVRFAKFNRLLNGADHLTVLQGDLFAPVKGLQFDRIVSNPPFEPPLKSHLIFSEGGADGEEILGRLIRETPEVLAPGGRLYANICATDREGETFDQRVVRWLGERADEFDVALFPRLELNPENYSIQQILGDNLDSWKLQEFNRFYAQLGAYKVVIGQLVIQRRPAGRAAFRVRRKCGPQTATPEMEWLLDWEARRLDAGLEAEVMAAKPVAATHWELVAKHAFAEGRLAPRGYTLKTKYPFEVDLHIAAWIAMTLAECKGQETTGELHEQLNRKMPVARKDFVAAMIALIGSGFVTVDGVPALKPTKQADARRRYLLQEE